LVLGHHHGDVGVHDLVDNDLTVGISRSRILRRLQVS
jgi:hypothetical protein